MRELLSQKPWIGIVVAIALLGGSIAILTRSGTDDPYSTERLTQDVTIVFSDTGEEIQMPRGRFEVVLWERQGQINPAEGIPNPKTGKLTGFPKKKAEWDEVVARINAEKAKKR